MKRCGTNPGRVVRWVRVRSISDQGAQQTASSVCLSVSPSQIIRERESACAVDLHWSSIWWLVI